MTPVIIILAVVIFIAAKCICIVPQSYQWVLETLGSYSGTWDSGLKFKIPFIQRISKKVSLKEQVADFEPQPVITKDNVTMMVDSVVFFQIFDAKLFTYGVERPMAAIENLSATTLRNIIGSMTLDETLTSRDSINTEITSVLDQATDKWGIKVNRVEVKNIQPPRSIQDAMEKQMKAEREKREKILFAEGEKQSAITLAEGEKEAAILRAEAIRERTIREAEGEAEALLKLQQARAEGIRLINEAQPSAQYLKLEQFKAVTDMANGQATKIVVPTDMTSMAGNFAVMPEFMTPVHNEGYTQRPQQQRPKMPQNPQVQQMNNQPRTEGKVIQ